MDEIGGRRAQEACRVRTHRGLIESRALDFGMHGTPRLTPNTSDSLDYLLPFQPSMVTGTPT